ncbi:MAG: hypothetical protein J6Q82_01820 [Clostridia bacterium]|nr:hypothetical protein [Clostridia bacterium]
MKIKTAKKTGIFTVLDFSEQEGRSYGLLCLQFERAIRYAIYIESGEECGLELVGNQRREAQKLFEQVVHGGLSPIHLREVAFDQRQEKVDYNFFC